MLTFKTLWDNHPTISGVDHPCSMNHEPNFSNQCAVRMGVCLNRCGIDTTQLAGVRHCRFTEHNGQGHTLSAEELANGLKTHGISGIKPVQYVSSTEFKRRLRGKTGIVFFKHYWQRTVNGTKETFRNRSGDHIDLWNRFRLSHPRSIIQVYLRMGPSGIGSDPGQSKEIWFWEVP